MKSCSVLHAACTAALLSGGAWMSGCAAQGERFEPDTSSGVVITTRDRWPRGVPLRATIEYTKVNYSPDALWVHATPLFRGGQRVSTRVNQRGVLTSGDHLFFDNTRFVGDLPPHTESVFFELSIIRDASDPFQIWMGSMVVPIKVVDSIDEAMTPVRDETIDAAFRNGSIIVARDRWKGEVDRVSEWKVLFEELPPQITDLGDVTFAMHVELLRGGQRVARGEGWWRPIDFGGGPEWIVLRGHMGGTRAIKLIGSSGLLDNIEHDEAAWTIRIRSNPEMALRDFKSEKYWSGDVIIALVVKELQLTWTDSLDPPEREWVTLYPRQ